MTAGFKTINIKSEGINESILYYIKSISFIHKITAPKDQKALSLLISKYIELSKDVLKEKLINTLLFSKDSSDEIKAGANMNKHEYSVFLKKLEERNILKENTLRKSVVPKINDDNSIELRLKFTI